MRSVSFLGKFTSGSRSDLLKLPNITLLRTVTVKYVPSLFSKPSRKVFYAEEALRHHLSKVISGQTGDHGLESLESSKIRVYFDLNNQSKHNTRILVGLVKSKYFPSPISGVSLSGE